MCIHIYIYIYRERERDIDRYIHGNDSITIRMTRVFPDNRRRLKGERLLSQVLNMS